MELERGFVVAVLSKGTDAEDELGELRELARTAGVEPAAELVQQRSHPDPRTYVGKGKLDELKQAYGDARAEVLLVDDELDPVQQRALENALDARVVDRTQLILDIFAQHATSAEGKLQVELAQLEYNLPRMRGMWKHLERLGGGTGALGAGVGTRGPGESQLETDRRLAGRRITLLRPPVARARQAARPAPEGTRAERHADRGARGLHERRQVDPPERAHRRGGLGREPPLRDARPDNARLRPRRQALSRDRHRRLHQAPADATRRGLRLDAGGDARRRSRPARRRRVGVR